MRVFVVIVGAALLAGGATSGGGASLAHLHPGVLFTSAPPPTQSGAESGLWVLSPSGRPTQLLTRRWHPWARSRTGVVAASRTRFPEGMLWLVSQQRTVRIPDSSGASCVSWSADGSLLTYVTGQWLIYAHLPRDQVAWGRVGAVWVVRASAPRKPLRIASGLSAAGACPAWSASETTLAYLIRSDPQSGPWMLNVHSGASTSTVATLAGTVPTLEQQPYDWAPDKSELVFVDGTSVYSYDGVATRLLGPANSLAPVESLSRSRGFDVDDVHVRFSPDGRFVAAGITGATGVLRRDGTLFQNFVGGFDGWAGSTGVLTLAAEPTVIILRLHPLDGSASQVVAKHFKHQVASDPGGRWFAYFDPHPGKLVFRRPDGTVMWRRSFRGRFPRLIAAVSADGRSVPPAGGYPSPWSR